MEGVREIHQEDKPPYKLKKMMTVMIRSTADCKLATDFPGISICLLCEQDYFLLNDLPSDSKQQREFWVDSGQSLAQLVPVVQDRL